MFIKITEDSARIELGDQVFVGRGVELDISCRLTVGNHVLFAPGCFITDHHHRYAAVAPIASQGCESAPVHIGNDVWLGAKAVVMSGVTIGDGAIVGAGAVVNRDVAPMTIVAGVPARIVGSREMIESDSVEITVVIPTYRREHVLLDTLQYLLALQSPPAEILVLDQTAQHEAVTMARLQTWADAGTIRWVRLAEPSIPKAMNQGLLLASHDVVLFVDDDIRPEPELLAAHLSAHTQHGDVIVAGRVIQPWQEDIDFSRELAFHFASLRSAWITEFMGGNFSLRRDTALALGGFDERFVRVAFRFEAEFAHRFCASGGRIWFEPAACLHHLKDASGGTRTYGNHLATWRPDHAVGAYYFGLRTGAWRGLLMRPLRAIATRHHLRHPWQMVGTLWAELRGMAWAWRLHRSGARLLPVSRDREAT